MDLSTNWELLKSGDECPHGCGGRIEICAEQPRYWLGCTNDTEHRHDISYNHYKLLIEAEIVAKRKAEIAAKWKIVVIGDKCPYSPDCSGVVQVHNPVKSSAQLYCTFNPQKHAVDITLNQYHTLLIEERQSVREQTESSAS
mgnify:CR=1 FL=1|jgi:hypothetical protein